MGTAQAPTQDPPLKMNDREAFPGGGGAPYSPAAWANGRPLYSTPPPARHLVYLPSVKMIFMSMLEKTPNTESSKGRERKRGMERGGNLMYPTGKLGRVVNNV